jgi:hypothetical protein
MGEWFAGRMKKDIPALNGFKLVFPWPRFYFPWPTVDHSTNLRAAGINQAKS